jgi:hypothetical protein
MSRIKAEPVAFAGLLTALVTAIIALLIGFEIVNWTEVQVGLILGVWSAVMAIVTFLVRGQVTPISGE